MSTRRMIFDVPEEMALTLERLKLQGGGTVTRLVRRAIADYLDQHVNEVYPSARQDLREREEAGRERRSQAAAAAWAKRKGEGG